MRRWLVDTFEMWFLILASVACTVFAAEDLDCLDPTTKMVIDSSIVCNDVATYCTAVFTTPLKVGELRPDTANCGKPDLKKLAVTQCPKFCGFCCKTPAYNCENKPYAQTGLNCTTMADKCMDKTWRPIITENCPATCGMCADSGCSDIAPDCASQPTLCFNVNFQDWAKENCARTCNQCPPAGATTAGAGATTAAPGAGPAPGATAGPVNPPAACVDLDVNCGNWARNGKFCNNSWYQTQWPKCRKSCGRC